jgi:hypothetical protein
MINWILSCIRKLSPLNGYYRVSVDSYKGFYTGDIVTIVDKRFKVVAIINRDLILKELTKSPT